MKAWIFIFALFILAADLCAQTPAQLAEVQNSAARRYISIVSVDGDVARCQVWGIGGVKDPIVAAYKKAGRRLKQYKNEFIYPLHEETDRFTREYEYATVKGLKWAKSNTEQVLTLYLVHAGHENVLYMYATTVTEAAKLKYGP